jgi:hypothetical protein
MTPATEAAAELRFYVRGLLAYLPSDDERIPRILAVVDEYATAIEAEAVAARLPAANVRVGDAGLREALDKHPWVWDTLPNDVQEAINAALRAALATEEKG